MSERTLTTAPILTSMATRASTVSNVPTVRGAATGRAAEGDAGALAGTGAAGRATVVPGRVGGADGAVAIGAPAGRGTWVVGAGAPAGRAPIGAPVAGAATGAAAPGPVAVGGKEGSLIVGAAVGFGGRAIRTVSFLGCTLGASGGLGAPPGGTGEFGVGSAITIARQPMGRQKQCQIVNAKEALQCRSTPCVFPCR